MFSVFTIFKAIFKAISIGFLTGFLASIPLGPSGLESVSRSISKGFREGFKVSLGAVSADIVYIVIINLGILSIFAKNSRFYSSFLVVSGIILILSTKMSFESKNSNSKLEKSLYRHSSNAFLTGFLITFLNPTTPSLWIALSGTVFNVWRNHGRMYFMVSISSMIIGSITWFCLLNILVSMGFKKMNPNYTNNTTKFLDYFLFVLGIIFIVLGIYKFIF